LPNEDPDEFSEFVSRQSLTPQTVMAHLPVTLLYREKFITDSLRESAETKNKIAEACRADISKAIDLIISALKQKKKILLCGNGGSAEIGRAHV
jgi:D-arabinose 5-phosphate isomerase GutQ